MATNPDKNLPNVDNSMNTNNNDDKNTKQEDQSQKSATLSTDIDQGGKTMNQVDNSNQNEQVDSLSPEQSSNTNVKSATTESSAAPHVSETNTEKKNEEQKVQTTSNDTKVEETGSTPASSNSDNDSKEQAAKESSNESNTNTSESNDNKIQSEDNNTFTIGKGDSKYLTDFQRQKAKYFFEVNLDIENKEHVTWEDVEFYILFHITAAGREGSNDLEKRLTESVRNFWNYVHNQVPLPDGKTDRLTLDQFLDTWASLTDYVIRRNQLPPAIQDLVKLGFELYSTDDNDGEPTSIQLNAFGHLFQKMNLVPKDAIKAYTFLTQNGALPLDADKIESLVKGVITSSDEEHVSHFLLPGFFNTLGNKNDEKERKSESSSPVPDNEQAEVQNESSPTSTPSSPQTNAPTEPQKPQESSSSQEEKLSNSPQFQNGPVKTAPEITSNNQEQPQQEEQQQQQQQQPLQSETPQKPPVIDEDENIRRLLRFYHIDDGDIVEVADGPKQRLVLVHPERPLPAYIQQNPQLLHRLRQDAKTAPSLQQNVSNTQATKPSSTQPKVSLQERLSRGEARRGPTIPLSQQQQQRQGHPSSIRVRQVYPNLSPAQQEAQQRQAKQQAANETSRDNNEPLSTSIKEDRNPEKVEIDPQQGERLVSAVLKQLAPLIEKRVADEVRRIQTGESDQDDDEGFMPFPFMFGPPPPFFMAQGRAPPSSQQKQAQQQSQEQSESEDAPQEPNGPRGPDFGGLPPGAAFLPPPLLMAMMSDFARGGLGGDIPIFPGNMPPPPRGPGGMPGGIEGFMMFVGDDQMMGGPPGFSPRAGPRF